MLKMAFPVAAAVALTVAVAMTPAAAGRSATPAKNIAVPVGLWIGKGSFKPQDATVGQGAGAVDVHITSGSYSIYLISDPWLESGEEITGDLYLKIKGSGEYTAKGFTGSAQLAFDGRFELADTDAPGAFFADGAYAMEGVVVVDVNGFQKDFPIKQTIPANGAVTITSSSCTMIKGELPSAVGGYPWSAKLWAPARKWRGGGPCS
jgi:hypothetical protein